MWAFASYYKNNDACLKGKTVIITGANAGIGFETAKDLYKRGARTLILCRDEKKTQQAIDELKKEDTPYNTSDIIYKHLDLADFSSVRKCAGEIMREEKQINILINNAGVLMPPNKSLDNGLETHIAVNHFGGALLTLLLLPRIRKSAGARIIFVSSMIHAMPIIGRGICVEDLNYENRRFFSLQAYGQSKLAQVIFSKELARRLKAHDINEVSTYSLHPGTIATNIWRNSDTLFPGGSWVMNKISSYLFLTPQQGALTTIYCAIEDRLKYDSGLYYSDCSVKSSHSLTYDQELAKKLWDTTMTYIKLDNYDPFKSEM